MCTCLKRHRNTFGILDLVRATKKLELSQILEILTCFIFSLTPEGVDKVLAIYRKHVDRSVERSMGFASRVAVVAPRIEAQMDELKQDVEVLSCGNATTNNNQQQPTTTTTTTTTTTNNNKNKAVEVVSCPVSNQFVIQKNMANLNLHWDSTFHKTCRIS